MMKNQNHSIDIEQIAHTYFYVKQLIHKKGFDEEINWQTNVSLELLTLSNFLREAAWVILSAGMKESVIASKFDYLSEIFHQWNIDKINIHKSTLKKRSLKIFNHPQKINSIIRVSEIITTMGIVALKSRINAEGIEFFQSLPFIGPITKYHLAKNIGIRCSKPDRHLVRISNYFGYNNPEKMCKMLSDYIDENISVIDLVFWRFATLERNYLLKFDSFIGNLD